MTLAVAVVATMTAATMMTATVAMATATIMGTKTREDEGNDNSDDITAMMSSSSQSL